MQSFITDQNQVEKIDGMTIEFPYCIYQHKCNEYKI